MATVYGQMLIPIVVGGCPLFKAELPLPLEWPVSSAEAEDVHSWPLLSSEAKKKRQLLVSSEMVNTKMGGAQTDLVNLISEAMDRRSMDIPPPVLGSNNKCLDLYKVIGYVLME